MMVVKRGVVCGKPAHAFACHARNNMSATSIEFKPLPLSSLKAHTGYLRPFFSTPTQVDANASAMAVMTDLQFVPAAIVHGEIDVESASQKMIARGVRALLVTDGDEDIIGIITSRDLLGRRPHDLMQRRGIAFGEVRVQDIMTPAADIEVIPLTDVLHAHVGDIILTLKHSGRQHALVVEEVAFSDKCVVRGIFSASQIARQLGVATQQHALYQTFAEIDRAIGSASQSMARQHG